MNLNRHSTEKILLQALFIAIFAATVARAGMAYLPLTGPAPLRISAAHKPAAPAVPTLVAAPAVANTNQLDLCVDHPGYTNSTAAANPGLFPLPAVKLGAGGVLDQTSGAGVFNLATPDFLAITPQMLAAYFQPVMTMTNGVLIPPPFRVGFIPPTVIPEKSSKAEYILK